MFYRKFRNDHNDVVVFLLFLIISYDVRIEHYKIAQCNIYYQYRLITSLILRLCIIILFPFSMLFNFSGTIKSFGNLFVMIGKPNYLQTYTLTIKEQSLIIK